MNTNYIIEQVIWVGILSQFNLIATLSENVIYIIVEG